MCTSARCTRPTPTWRCITPATSTPGATRASASGSSPRGTSPPAARTRRIRSSPLPGTRSTGTRPSTTSPTTFRTCDERSRDRPREHGMELSDDDTPYDGLTDEHGEDHRWAFGTGFTDPLEGVDTPVPDGVDAGALATYCLMLGDDALVYSHRLQQWMTRMPELEEETAIANIALDLLGQARMLLARAGAIEGRTEDQLAFFRDEPEFRNVRLVERRDADFAELVGRLLVFSTWRLALFERLQFCPDPVLAAIAAKGINELAYHRDYSAQWVIRLGDGTELSRQRMQDAFDTIWPLVDELFEPTDVELF